jgi:hypothetical protein
VDCGTKNDVNFATFFTGDAKHPDNLILDTWKDNQLVIHANLWLSCDTNLCNEETSIFSTFHGEANKMKLAEDLQIILP